MFYLKKVISLTSVIVIAGTTLHFINQDKKPAQEIILGDSYNEGDNDNPYDRFEYEHMMLADPATGKIPEGIRERELAFAETLPVANDDASRSNIAWTNRGPWNVGGRTRALAID